jgi:hypothetical protein
MNNSLKARWSSCLTQHIKRLSSRVVESSFMAEFLGRVKSEARHASQDKAKHVEVAVPRWASHVISA